MLETGCGVHGGFRWFVAGVFIGAISVAAIVWAGGDRFKEGYKRGFMDGIETATLVVQAEAERVRAGRRQP